MKPTYDLITALRTTADQIESGKFRYSWTDPTSCNCGSLVKNLGVTRNEIDQAISGEWSYSAWNSETDTASAELKNLFRKLNTFGIDSTFIHELEYCDNANHDQFRNPTFVSQWMRIQASYLEGVLERETVTVKQSVLV